MYTIGSPTKDGDQEANQTTGGTMNENESQLDFFNLKAALHCKFLTKRMYLQSPFSDPDF